MVRTSPPARRSSVPIHSTWPRGSRFHDSRSSRPWSRSHLHRSSRRSRSARPPWESHRTCSLPEAAARKNTLPTARQGRASDITSHSLPPKATRGAAWLDRQERLHRGAAAFRSSRFRRGGLRYGGVGAADGRVSGLHGRLPGDLVPQARASPRDPELERTRHRHVLPAVLIDSPFERRGRLG